MFKNITFKTYCNFSNVIILSISNYQSMISLSSPVQKSVTFAQPVHKNEGDQCDLQKG